MRNYDNLGNAFKSVVKELVDIRPILITAPMVALVFFTGTGLNKLFGDVMDTLAPDWASLAQVACFVLPAACYLAIYAYLSSNWQALYKKYASKRQARKADKAYDKSYWK